MRAGFKAMAGCQDRGWACDLKTGVGLWTGTPRAERASAMLLSAPLIQRSSAGDERQEGGSHVAGPALSLTPSQSNEGRRRDAGRVGAKYGLGSALGQAATLPHLPQPLPPSPLIQGLARVDASDGGALLTAAAWHNNFLIEAAVALDTRNTGQG